jgi:hypothetical protein
MCNKLNKIQGSTMLKKPFLMTISGFLAFVIAFMAFTPVFATENSTAGYIEITHELKEANRHVYYSFLSGRILHSFPTALVQDEFGVREIILYPPEYAGRYLDESGTQHIILTKDADYETTIHNYQEIMGIIDEDIIYEVADFSLSRLYEVQRTLDNVMFEFDMSATSINEITNRLDINIEKGRENDVIEFLKTKFNDFNSRCITFSGPAEFHLTAADVASNVLKGSNNDYGNGIFGEGKTVVIICFIVVVLALTVGTITAGLFLYFKKGECSRLEKS